MNKKEFFRLVKKDKYQVFLLSSPVPFPISFLIHPWFITVKKGRINRWEVIQFPNQCRTSWGHVHLNYLEPWKGWNVIPFGEKIRFDSKLIGKIEGGKNSVAGKMIKLIEKNARTCFFVEKYNPFTFNSNSFVQWILDSFPDSGLKLPWNAWGKNYLSLY